MRKKKRYNNIKRIKADNSKTMFMTGVPENTNEVDSLDDYYSILAQDITRESNTSLYATTPDNPSELRPDEEMAGEDAIHNLHSKFKRYK